MIFEIQEINEKQVPKEKTGNVFRDRKVRDRGSWVLFPKGV